MVQLLFQCHARMNGPVSHACAARASLDALPAVFELMPAITYASANGEEKTIEGTVYTLTMAATRL